MAMQLPAYLVGDEMRGSSELEVFYPWDGSLSGTCAMIDRDTLETTIDAMTAPGLELPTRFERHDVLRKAASLLLERADEFADTIRLESGLCRRENQYEVGRTRDVLEFAAMEALRDDGQVFSCDISPQGKARKIFTFRQPVALAAAVTPFNHPLNQVAHKVAPAIAAGAPLLLKPSEKTPLTALKFTALLYEAGLPPWMLSTFVGSIDDVVTPMITHPKVDAVSFTGSVEIGKHIAKTVGYRKLCLELGGNSPLIILDDADLELAVKLASEGSFRNSGQRCTAVKRILVQRGIHDRFCDAFVESAKSYRAGDPADPETRVGTVIDEEAAKTLESRVQGAVSDGAQVLLGGTRRGALMEPTVLRDVRRESEIVAKESFGPLAPIVPIEDLDDAIDYYNGGPFGLSSAICTRDLNLAMNAAKRLRCGTTNINEVPGYRLESTPFGGVRDSGLGVKEGVVESMNFLATVKTFSLPW
ncbi:MAG: aldehyde dehydrogenase family protein [Planctomycetota bacterium]